MTTDRIRHLILPTPFLILFLLIVASVGRLPGILWGIPTFDRFVTKATYHPDEPKVVDGAKNFPADYLQRKDLRYPTAMHYMSGTLMLPLRAAKNEYQTQFYNDVYFLGTRFVSLIHSLAAILLTYFLGRKLLGETVGLIAMALMVVGTYHVRSASLGTTDGMTSAWLVACILLVLQLESKRSWLDFLALGAALGLLVGTKYNGAFVIILIGILAVQYLWESKERSKRVRLIIGLSLCGLTSIVVFFLTTPAALFNWQRLINSLQYESTRLGREILPIWNPQVWAHFLFTTIEATGWPIAVLSLLGLIGSFFGAGRKLLPLSILAILYYIYFRNSLLPRYLVTIFPLLCLFAAYFLYVICSSPKFRLRNIGWALLVFTLAYGAYQVIILNENLSNDTRSTAAEFISEELHTGSTISLIGGEGELWRFPKIDSSLTVVDATEKPDYLVTSSFDDFAEGVPEEAILAQDLINGQYELIAEFAPEFDVNVEFVSPLIRIYQRRNSS